MQSKRNPAPKRTSPGIELRHSRKCASRSGSKCNCTPSVRAWAYDRRGGTKIRKTFATQAAAKAWRSDATSQLNRGRRLGSSRTSLRDAAETWLAGATADPPLIFARTGRPYKPSVLRGYEADLRLYVLPELGGRRLTDVARGDLQALVDRLIGRGFSDSKVRNVVMPVRVIYRHAIERDQVAVNPTSNLRLPSGLGTRDRVATADEAAALIGALREADSALWATAFYAGLRLGELRALRWDDVDLASGAIKVERSWDVKNGDVEPKSRKGKRRVPITATLRDHLVEHKTRTGRDGADLVFGATRERPFTPSYLRKRALGAWAAAAVGAFLTRRPLPVELEPIGFHECRHTYVSLMIDAGFSLERIGDYAGHSSSYMTDRYRHLLEGHEPEAARIFDDYLARASTAARIEQLAND